MRKNKKYNLLVFKNMNDLNKYLFQIIYKNKNQNIIISWGDSLKQFFF